MRDKKVKIIDNCKSENKDIKNIVNMTKEVIAFLPKVISNLIIKICLLANIQLPESANTVTEMKNSLVIKKCKYIKNNNIYINGAVIKIIYYSNLNELKYYKIDIPFEVFTCINDLDEKIDDFKKSFKSKIEIDRELISEDITEINNLPYFEIISNKIIENAKFILDSNSIDENNIVEIDSKMVIKINLEMLKKENIYISSVHEYEKDSINIENDSINIESSEEIIEIEFDLEDEVNTIDLENINNEEKEIINAEIEKKELNIELNNELNIELNNENNNLVNNAEEDEENEDYNFQIIDQKMKKNIKIKNGKQTNTESEITKNNTLDKENKTEEIHIKEMDEIEMKDDSKTNNEEVKDFIDNIEEEEIEERFYNNFNVIDQSMKTKYYNKPNTKEIKTERTKNSIKNKIDESKRVVENNDKIKNKKIVSKDNNLIKRDWVILNVNPS